MKIKTSELTGPALDWAVALAHGAHTVVHPSNGDMLPRLSWPPTPTMSTRTMTRSAPEYSRDWLIAGPVIEREGILLRAIRKPGHNLDFQWLAMYDGTNTGTMVQWVKRTDWERHYWQGPTPLIAAMRCFVASRLGDEVEVPDELA